MDLEPRWKQHDSQPVLGSRVGISCFTPHLLLLNALKHPFKECVYIWYHHMAELWVIGVGIGLWLGVGPYSLQGQGNCHGRGHNSTVLDWSKRGDQLFPVTREGREPQSPPWWCQSTHWRELRATLCLACVQLLQLCTSSNSIRTVTS